MGSAMKSKLFLFTALALGGVAFASIDLIAEGHIRQANAATFIPSGEKWIDDIARYDNHLMWLALKSTDFKINKYGDPQRAKMWRVLIGSAKLCSKQSG